MTGKRRRDYEGVCVAVSGSLAKGTLLLVNFCAFAASNKRQSGCRSASLRLVRVTERRNGRRRVLFSFDGDSLASGFHCDACLLRLKNVYLCYAASPTYQNAFCATFVEAPCGLAASAEESLKISNF